MILTPELIQRADAAGRTVTDDAETLSYSDLAARVAETVEKLDAQPWAAPGYTVALPLTRHRRDLRVTGAVRTVGVRGPVARGR